MFGNKEEKIEKLAAKNNAGALIKMINEKDMALSVKAITALGTCKGDDAYNTLIALLRSPSAEIRAATATALGTLGDPKAHAHLDHLMASEKDSKVAAAMKAALSKLHSKE